MHKDKKVLYTISLITFALLFAALFIKVGNSKISTGCLLVPVSALTCLLIKRRRALSINKKEVALLSCVMGILYVALFQMTGMFLGFYKNPYFVTLERFIETVIPLTVIIIATEIIRYVILAQNDKFASFITYLTCVLTEILSFSSFAGITSFNRFMDLVGLTLFPAISANIYYHYISKRYGMMPNIWFKLIISLYIYFIPVKTGMSDSLSACIMIILPIIMLALTSAMFEKEKKRANVRSKKAGRIGTACAVVVIVAVAMLISCQFRFGALVIATDSMTGEINKGDMIIYEQYSGQKIEEGQVIVFQSNGSKIVHRVVRIENIDGQTRYYTKGDANEDEDNGYRVLSDIVGLTDVKLAYIGYPTLWIRSIIEN